MIRTSYTNRILSWTDDDPLRLGYVNRTFARFLFGRENFMYEFVLRGGSWVHSGRSIFLEDCFDDIESAKDAAEKDFRGRLLSEKAVVEKEWSRRGIYPEMTIRVEETRCLRNDSE